VESEECEKQGMISQIPEHWVVIAVLSSDSQRPS